MLSIPFSGVISRVAARWPVAAYAATWTTLLTLSVAIASFTPEVAFVSAISASSSFSSACNSDVYIRVPLDVPSEILCLPTQRFTNSNLDLIVPPIFAALIVTISALFVRLIVS